MGKKIAVIGFAMLLIVCLPVQAAGLMDSQVLIEHAQSYDHQTVTFEGEVIGDIMVRGEYAWMNISDGSNAIGIWVPAAATKTIRLTGGYRTTGDRVRVTGVFHRACPEHGGDIDIHTGEIEIISAGQRHRVDLDDIKAVWAALLSFLAAGIVYTVRRRPDVAG